MTTHSAFETSFKEFLKDLAETIPEEPKIAEYIEEINKTETKEVMDVFLKSVKNKQGVFDKDESILEDPDNILVKLNVNAYWKDLSTKTKDAIWQYLNTLLVLATTVKSIPQDMLSMIESMAEKCAGEMKDRNPEDMQDLFAGMQNMMKNVMQQTEPKQNSRPKSALKKKKKY